ncbi:hypothetical protein PROFUN_03249 [Planoprotostelium fungivorum]|uniref:Uncharacterized protein n=1 Tax=Planoprotostelium fungivorum TaxID=1890364 RepID=A0A2P6NWJ7_9EUKA|nr:hypothetical protein PROFUN_03249 [Planoprotostelium fungivorum]
MGSISPPLATLHIQSAVEDVRRRLTYRAATLSRNSRKTFLNTPSITVSSEPSTNGDTGNPRIPGFPGTATGISAFSLPSPLSFTHSTTNQIFNKQKLNTNINMATTQNQFAHLVALFFTPLFFAWSITKTVTRFWVELNLRVFAYALGVVCYFLGLPPREILDSFSARVEYVAKRVAEVFHRYNDRLQAASSNGKKSN